MLQRTKIEIPTFYETIKVGRSSFKTTLYGINVICEGLQNSLTLRGPCSLPHALFSLSLIPGDYSFIGYFATT